ncbi:hypothetical protein Ahy_A06g026501 [Arachis hypogaea]|uniref:Uncharacterized protein n=1 Tax=Arachis hypogaea TaxID=3818 RepID=A0A445CKQ8_ARAHY|nr:hypothetical protein Ahy_A06g026501 [Arachis hypogaea]
MESDMQIRLVFEGHGTIVEVVLLKDKRTSGRQGLVFVNKDVELCCGGIAYAVTNYSSHDFSFIPEAREVRKL